MSLETEVKANTVAVLALTAAILSLGGKIPAATLPTLPGLEEETVVTETPEQVAAREAQEAADAEAAAAEKEMAALQAKLAAAKAKAAGGAAPTPAAGKSAGNTDSLAKARAAKTAADAKRKAEAEVAALTGGTSEEATPITQATLRELGVAYLKKDTKEGSAKLTKLLAKHGATNHTTIPKDKYQAVFDELTALNAA